MDAGAAPNYDPGMDGRDAIQLTPLQIDRYRRDGFVMVDGVLGDDEVDRFVAHSDDSAGNETYDAHGLRRHTVDPMWAQTACHRNVAGVASQLLNGAPRIVQTMYMRKAPGGPAAATDASRGIALHQDGHYLPNDPRTLMACWIALTDTDAANGGLCVVPGSHRGPLRPTRMNEDDDHVTWEHEHLMRDRDGGEWTQRFYAFRIDGLDAGDVAPLDVPRGAAVFFDGMTIHGSYANRTTDRPRVAFAVHFVKEGTWLYRADVQETVPALSSGQ